jgi:beta propeller repeat protein
LKNKEKPHSKTLLLISLTFVCLISISSVVLAASTQLTDSKLTTETGITSSGSVEGVANGSVDILATEVSVDNPTGSVAAIYGDKIVWTDNRNGMNDLYMYDLSANKETQISNQSCFLR